MTEKITLGALIGPVAVAVLAFIVLALLRTEPFFYLLVSSILVLPIPASKLDRAKPDKKSLTT